MVWWKLELVVVVGRVVLWGLFSGGLKRLEWCGVYCLCVSPFLVFVWRGGRSRRVVFAAEMRLMLDGGYMAL